MLKNAARLPNGRIRVTAERLLEGADMGRFEYHGTRDDDPNDIYPHEHRRELRGSRVFAAWLNHDDSRAVNTMVMRHIESGRGYLKYYMVDFGSLLGSATRFPNAVQSGHEYTLTGRPSLLTLLSFGLYVRPWLRLPDPPAPPAVGRFSAEGFDPRTWVAEYPKAAFDNMRADDAFWAARIVARFSDDAIRAIVGEGPVLRSGRRRGPDRRAHQAARSDQGGVADRHQPDRERHACRPRGSSASRTRRRCTVSADVRTATRSAGRDSTTPPTPIPSVGDEVTVADPRALAPSGVLAGSDYVSVRIATRHPALSSLDAGAGLLPPHRRRVADGRTRSRARPPK